MPIPVAIARIVAIFSKINFFTKKNVITEKKNIRIVPKIILKIYSLNLKSIFFLKIKNPIKQTVKLHIIFPIAAPFIPIFLLFINIILERNFKAMPKWIS